MSNYKQRLERIVKRYEGILDDPCMGHTLLEIVGISPGIIDNSVPRCWGCNKPWAKLEANNFLPVCSNPTGITGDIELSWPLEGDE